MGALAALQDRVDVDLGRVDRLLLQAWKCHVASTHGVEAGVVEFVRRAVRVDCRQRLE